MKRILVVRPDRIGDVVLSLPFLKRLVEETKNKAEVFFLIREDQKPILDSAQLEAKFVGFDPEGRHSGVLGFQRLVNDLKKLQINDAIQLQVNPRLVTAQKIAGIKNLVGPRSKWVSYLFFNKSLRQNRSEAKKHEARYTLELLSLLGIENVKKEVFVSLKAKKEHRNFFKERLSVWGMTTKPWVLIHPGMRGSALNWSAESYRKLIERLLEKRIGVVVSGAQADQEFILKVLGKELRPGIGLGLQVHVNRSGALGLEEYMALLSLAPVVVVPSTGPLHLATGLGVPTVSVYPPIQVQHARRWGPWFDSTDSSAVSHEVFTPQVECPAVFHCLESKCSKFPCMQSISVDQVFDKVTALVVKNRV